MGFAWSHFHNDQAEWAIEEVRLTIYCQQPQSDLSLGRALTQERSNDSAKSPSTLYNTIVLWSVPQRYDICEDDETEDDDPTASNSLDTAAGQDRSKVFANATDDATNREAEE